VDILKYQANIYRWIADVYMSADNLADWGDSKMMSKTLLVAAALVICISCTGNDTTTPRVVKTFPANGSQDVDPSLTELYVVFNEEMQDHSWSWVYEDQNTFPTMTGQPYYAEGNTKNILPVQLEPDKEYVIWINQPEYQNFRDNSGNSAAPFRFTFRTKSSPLTANE
jgi:hypothetical protein